MLEENVLTRTEELLGEGEAETAKARVLLTHGSASVIASDKEAISKGFDWVVEFAEILSEAIQQDQSGQRITWEDAKKQLGW